MQKNIDNNNQLKCSTQNVLLNRFNLSDLFGNSIEPYESYPFLIISSDNVLNLLQETSSKSIFKFNMKLIKSILKEYDVEDISQYVSPGFVHIKQVEPKQIILLNKNICSPVDIKQLYKIPINGISGNIWSYGQNIKIFSMFYSDSDTSLQNDLKDIYTIDSRFLTKYKNQQNEFFLLNTNNTTYTINRNMFKNGSSTMKIMANDYNYITISDGKLILKSKNTSNMNQEVNYTVQGELKLDGKCITKLENKSKSDYDFSLVSLEECSNDDSQKWYPYDGSFVSQYDTMCLSYDDETKTLKTKECTNDSKETWNIEFQHQVDPNDYNIPYFKGKSVVLVEADNPWYLNKDISNPSNYDDGSYIDNINKVSPRNYGIIPEEDYIKNILNNTSAIKTPDTIAKIKTRTGVLPLDDAVPKDQISPIENFSLNSSNTYNTNNSINHVWDVSDIFGNYLCWIFVIVIILLIINSKRK
jgi:hypothetical protein